MFKSSQDDKALKLLYAIYISELLNKRVIPEGVPFTSKGVVDYFYNFGELPNNRYLIYYNGALHVVLGFNRYGQPVKDGIYYTTNGEESLTNLGDTERSMVMKARELVKLSKMLTT